MKLGAVSVFFALPLQFAAAQTTLTDTYIKVTPYDGTAASAPGVGAIALSSGATSYADGDIAIGRDAVANGLLNGSSISAVSIGSLSKALGQGAVSMGVLSAATADNAVAIGRGSVASSAGSVAMGQGANATGTASLAFGQNAYAIANNSIALGAGSTANRVNTVSVGTAGAERQVVNVLAGTQNNDAVNFSQLKAVSQSAVDALGSGSVNTNGTFSAPSYTVGGTTVNNVGAALTKLDSQLTQITNGTLGLVQQDAVTSDINVATGKNGTKVNFAGTQGNRVLTGVGTGAVNALSVDAMNGSQLYATSQSAANALGGGSVVNADGTISAPSYTVDGTTVNNVGDALANLDGRTTTNTTAIDTLSTQLSNGSIGLVQQDAATSDITVAAGTNGTKVNFAGTEGNRVLTGVGAGAVNASSVDAINGSQLYATSQSAASALGGGSVVNADGTISAPSYTVDGTTVNNVGAAITNLDGRTTTNTAAIDTLSTQLSNGSIGLVQQDGATSDINVATNTNGTKVNFAGTQGNRVLTGVGAGAVDALSMDAINGSQLYATSQSAANALGGGSVVNADGTISAPSYTVGGTTVTNVGDALTNLDGRTTTNTTAIDTLNAQLSSGSIGLVQQDAVTKVVTVAAATGGTSVSVAGTDGDRTITGVKDGEADNDAVNVKQLKSSGLIDSATGQALSAVVYDSAAKDSITLGGLTAAAPVVLRNVAAGEISATSNQAVNGSQLFAVNQTVLAQGASITNIDGRVTNVESTLQGVASGTVGLVKQDPASGNITVAAETGGNAMNVAGTAGDRTITGVAAGVADNDAVNMAQLKSAGLVDANGQAVSAVTYDSSAKDKATLGNQGTAVSLTNVADGNVAAGSTDAVTGNQLYQTNQQIGGLAEVIGTLQASGISQIAVAPGGENASATGTGSVALGGNSTASGEQGVSIGSGASAAGDYSVALGGNSLADGTNSTAIGDGSRASGNGSTALGHGSKANGADSLAMGQDAAAIANNSVALGANSVADRENTVSVGSAGNERQITNVAAGTQRTDAANWGQVQDAVGGVKDWANQQFSKVNRNIDRVGAMSAAYGQMAFSAQGLQTANKVGVGIGTQNGRSAIAVGYSRQIKPNLNLSIGSSASGSDVSVGAGMSLGW